MRSKKRSHLAARWRLAERIISCAEEVRNANKPADLCFPQAVLLDLSHQINEQKYQWLGKKLGIKAETYGRWPNL